MLNLKRLGLLPTYQYYQKNFGLSLVFFVIIHLTLEPDLMSFLNISKDTSFLKKISVISFIINGFLRSGLSVPYLVKHLRMKFLGSFQIKFFY